jgi:transposase
MRPIGIARELESRRRIAGPFLLEGKYPAEVARTVGVSWTTANRWKEAVFGDGLSALSAKPHQAKSTKLSPRQREQLVEILSCGAAAAGFTNEMWTCPRVAELIQREFGVSYHVGHVWKLLRSLGWTCKMPRQRSRTHDDNAVQSWREQAWPRIKKRLKKAAKQS